MRPLVMGASAAGVATPVIWEWLGYEFEAAPMVMALASCLVVRVYYGLRARSREGWLADVAISVLTFLITGAAIIQWRPGILTAAFAGTAFGAIGVRLIHYAVNKLRPLLGDDMPDTPHAHAGRNLRSAHGSPASDAVPDDHTTLLDRLD